MYPYLSHADANLQLHLVFARRQPDGCVHRNGTGGVRATAAEPRPVAAVAGVCVLQCVCVVSFVWQRVWFPSFL
jgi:hypothetical protein